MRKPRLLLHIHYLHLGGAERAFLGLLDALDLNRVDVDVMLNSHEGALLPLVRKDVTLLPELTDYSVIERRLTEALRKGCFRVAAARVMARLAWFAKRPKPAAGRDDYSIFHFVGKYVTSVLPPLRGRYDLAISFLTPHQIVADKVDAAVKLAWIHTDYSRVSVCDDEESVWNRYDRIVSISPGVTRSFIGRFPSLASKIMEICNVLSPGLLKAAADNGSAPEFLDDRVNILSVGRFCHAKNFGLIPHVASLLRDRGLSFRWVVIGPGDQSEVRRQIEDTDTADLVILAGPRENPYPYICRCDIYVQPSRYEGNCVTVEEAKVFHRPIVVTDYPTARCQIVHGEIGLIATPDATSVADAVERVARDNTLRETLVENLAKTAPSVTDLEKIYSLL